MQKMFSLFKNNIYAKTALILFSAVLVLFCFLLFIFKYLISYSFIEKKFDDITGLKIEFVEPDTNFDFRFNLNIKAKKINVYDKTKKNCFVSLDSPNIAFKPLGFLFNRAYFKKVDINNIDIKLNRNLNGQIDILNALNKDLDKFINKNIKVTRLNANIAQINLLFSDEYLIKSQIKLNLKNTDIDINKKKKTFSYSQTGFIETNINNNKQIANISAKLNSKYPIENLNSNDLEADINLDNINLYIFNDLVKKYISKDIKYTKGQASLAIKTQDEKQRFDLKIINPTLGLNNGKIISPYKNNVDICAYLTLNKKQINIQNAKISSDNLLMLLDGNILEPFSKNPKVDLNIESKNTQINNLIPFIPDNAIFYRPKGIPTLKKSNFYALANGKVNLKLFPLNVEGNLKVENIHIPNYPKPYKQNDVNLIFMKDKVRVYTRVYTPDNEYVLIDGISNLDNSLYGEYSVKSTSKIDLSFAQLYLVPIQQVIGFNIGPVPIMDIKGYGNIDISAKGTIFDGQVFGIFNAYNASAKMKGLDANLENATCKLVFNDKDVVIEQIKGKIEDGDFSLKGKANIKGEVELNTQIKNVSTSKILKVFNNSIIAKPYIKHTKNIAATSGKMNADINLSGVVKDFENESFLEELIPFGEINLINNKVILNNGFTLDKLSSIAKFGKEQSIKADFNIKNSRFNLEVYSKDDLSKIAKGDKFNVSSQISSNKIAFSDVLDSLNSSKLLNENHKKFTSQLNGINFYTKLFLKSTCELTINELNFDKIKNSGYLIGLNSSQNENIKFNSGLIKFENNKIKFDNLKIGYKQGKIFATGNIYNAFSKNPLGDLIVKFEDISLEKLDKVIPKIKTPKGVIKSGQLIFRNNNLKLNSISMDLGEAPLFLNANLKNIYDLKSISANFSTILNEKTSDNIINPYLVSPLKITGEMPIKGTFYGDINNYNISFSVSIPRNSDISFSGANLGDINHKREITGVINVADNVVKLNNIRLVKYIANQNNKINPLNALKVDGKIVQKNNSVVYDDLKITTNTPINVRVLNLIFKKSILKKGNFDCNISLNGDLKLPKILGRVNLYDLDIPLYNTKIDSIKFNILNKYIDGEILAKNKQSDVKLDFIALNKFDTPYIVKDFKILSNKLDINDILNSIYPSSSKVDIEVKNDFIIKPSDVVIEKGTFDFREVQYNKVVSQNLKGKLNYKDNIVNLDDVSLDIAQGSIDGSGKYNIKSTKLDMSAKMINCDSNLLAKEFLGLSNQIFGKMDGTIVLSGKNLNTPQGIKNVKSEINFSIDDGKMPKLGSLEYLLRAGNLFKNGILGLSLNNIIEVLTPYKTGEFDKISGSLSVKDGEVEKLNILSKGKNLSLFLEGNYSILEKFAYIEIYGKLSQNISNALGALGNASINQFINMITQSKHDKNLQDEKLQEKLYKIPPIEVENPQPRYFKARVLGDINKDDYIKSFNWI